MTGHITTATTVIVVLRHGGSDKKSPDVDFNSIFGGSVFNNAF